ncbi:hypothetical protein [Serratia marcescens]|uniref:hypothetical protein n=1 Tax=Serratia marcescens TaxID=615 RepID=UPI0027E419DB|nr:hypothetical protein [Serratia marcescens]MCX2172115.1 hypothetical protein [Serratia marcescens]MCX2178013.1 hypothetical protein [Serratia marcescens]
MSPKAHALMAEYCERVLHRPLESCIPTSLGGYETMGCLWPMNEVFRPRFEQIKTVRYRKQYEKAADEAIYNFVMHDADWANLPLVVWRVLLERHQQAILLCVANAIVENPAVMYVPADFTESARTKFAVVYLLYAMNLPYEVTDESKLDIDSPYEGLSERLH